MTFDEWLDEQEGFATRRERLFSDVDFEAVMTGNASCRFMQKRMLVWLEAAYEIGKQEAETLKNPPRMPSPATDLVPSIAWPTWPNTNPPGNLPPMWNNWNRCSKCGMDLTGAMGFVCGDMQCPTFMRVTC